MTETCASRLTTSPERVAPELACAPPPARHLRPRPRRRRAPPRHRRDDRALARPRGQEAAGPPRPARRQPLLRVVDAHAVELRPGRQAALGRHDGAALVGLVRRQGRVAEGHGADARRVRPGRDRDPASAHRRAAARRRRDARARRQRRRRQAPASDPGAARPLHDARGARPARRPPRRDRRRRAALARGALADRGARARRRAHDARRPADAHAARDRARWAARSRRRSATIGAADVVYVLRMQQERMLAGAAYVPSLREYAAEWGITPRPAPPRPGRDAPRADEPRRRDRPARRRLGRLADHRAGALGPRRADGGALRPARRRPGRRRPARWRSHDALLARTAPATA